MGINTSVTHPCVAVQNTRKLYQLVQEREDIKTRT